jgi:hypothetical protein
MNLIMQIIAPILCTFGSHYITIQIKRLQVTK